MLRDQLRKEEEADRIAQEEQLAMEQRIQEKKKRLSLAVAGQGSDNEGNDSMNEEVKDENDKLHPKDDEQARSNRSAQSDRQMVRKEPKKPETPIELNLEKFEEEVPEPVVKESLVGKKLSDLTTRKVILIVLAMLFSAPIFIVTTFVPDPSGEQIGLDYIALFEPGTPGFNYAFENYVELQKSMRKDLLLIAAADVIWESGTNPNDLRSNEKEFVSTTNSKGESFVAVIDLRANTTTEAMLSIF